MNHDGAYINNTKRSLQHHGAFLFPACTKRMAMRQLKKFCEANHLIY